MKRSTTIARCIRPAGMSRIDAARTAGRPLRRSSPPLPALATAHSVTLSYENIVPIHESRGAKRDLNPIVRIVSPLNRAVVAPGESRVGAGSPNGAGFGLDRIKLRVDRSKASGQALTPPAESVTTNP